MANGAPKIVHIDTRYVETDATHFRDVVQHLTGKNSTTNWVGSGAVQDYYNKRGIVNYDDQDGRAKPLDNTTAATDGKKNASTSASSVLLVNMSLFQDFQGLLSDLPPLEDQHL